MKTILKNKLIAIQIVFQNSIVIFAHVRLFIKLP